MVASYFHILPVDWPKWIYSSNQVQLYGMNTKTPFSETDVTDRPASLYGATKKSDELLAHSYAHLTGLPIYGTYALQMHRNAMA